MLALMYTVAYRWAGRPGTDCPIRDPVRQGISMSADTGGRPDRRGTATAGSEELRPAGRGAVQQASLPPGAMNLSTLARVDYHDAFLADASRHPDRTAAQWARAMLSDAP